MNVASGPELAAAVTNYGGLGVIGGHGYTPKVLRQQVRPTRKRIVNSLQDRGNPTAPPFLDPYHQGWAARQERAIRRRFVVASSRRKRQEDQRMYYIHPTRAN